MIPRAAQVIPLPRVFVLFLSCWLLAGLLRAAAPDTLSGFVFRTTQTGGFLNLGSSIEDTFVLGADGRWTHLRATHRSGASFTPYRTSVIDATMGNGPYTYVKTGENTATLTLVDQLAPGLSSPLYRYGLGFATTIPSTPPVPATAVYSGGFSRTREIFILSGGFTLTPLASLDSAPVANVAMRGHASADRPLVVGFVVPAGRVQDMLIRAVALR
jgi:hypothetical protein